MLDLFLQVFDDGILTDAQGRKCDFRESVIILTSNWGSGELAMPLADAILAGRLRDGRRIRVGVGKDGLRIDWGGS